MSFVIDFFLNHNIPKNISVITVLNSKINFLMNFILYITLNSFIGLLILLTVKELKRFNYSIKKYLSKEFISHKKSKLEFNLI